MSTEETKVQGGEQQPAQPKPKRSSGGSRMGKATQKQQADPESKGVAGSVTAPPAQIDYNLLADMVASRLAPVFHTRTPEVVNDGMTVNQMADIALDDGTIATGGASIEAVYGGGLNTDYMAELAFMEEMVEVMVHETEDANAENPVIVGVNGIFKPFFRGQKTTARRKFVDGLIVKSTRVTTPEILNGAGERTNVIRQHSAHKYSFSILLDKNPKGREWLARRMAEAI